MTPKKFIFFLFLQWFFFAANKLLFFKYISLSNQGFQQILFWLFTGVLAAALIRRLGVMSFLEAIFIIVVWEVFDLFFDLVILSVFTGLSIFLKWPFWVGYFAMAAGIFFLHKKRHIEIRKEMAKLHHGHH